MTIAPATIPVAVVVVVATGLVVPAVPAAVVVAVVATGLPFASWCWVEAAKPVDRVYCEITEQNYSTSAQQSHDAL